jgi:hypothetical protein
MGADLTSSASAKTCARRERPQLAERNWGDDGKTKNQRQKKMTTNGYERVNQNGTWILDKWGGAATKTEPRNLEQSVEKTDTGEKEQVAVITKMETGARAVNRTRNQIGRVEQKKTWNQKDLAATCRRKMKLRSGEINSTHQM